MSDQDDEELNVDIAETWTLTGVQELLAGLPRDRRPSSRAQTLPGGEIVDVPLLRSTIDVWLSPTPYLHMCYRHMKPLESTRDARDALQKLEESLLELGPNAYRYLNRAMRYMDQDSNARSPRTEINIDKIVEAVSMTIKALRADIRPGPRPDVPFGRAGPRSKLARELVLAYYRLMTELPPTTHPDQRTKSEHPYHKLVREAFDLAGFGAWKKNAQKAACWLRKLRVDKPSLN